MIMGRGLWNTRGVSPFFTERARSRAPRILSYAAVGGTALLVDPSGQVVMVSGTVDGVDLEAVAQLAEAAAASHRRSFEFGGTSVQVAPVTAGWTLCALPVDLTPEAMNGRLARASAVMALALVDGRRPCGSGSPPSGAAAEVVLPNRERTN